MANALSIWIIMQAHKMVIGITNVRLGLTDGVLATDVTNGREDSEENYGEYCREL